MKSTKKQAKSDRKANKQQERTKQCLEEVARDAKRNQSISSEVFNVKMGWINESLSDPAVDKSPSPNAILNSDQIGTLFKLTLFLFNPISQEDVELARMVSQKKDLVVDDYIYTKYPLFLTTLHQSGNPTIDSDRLKLNNTWKDFIDCFIRCAMKSQYQSKVMFQTMFQVYHSELQQMIPLYTRVIDAMRDLNPESSATKCRALMSEISDEHYKLRVFELRYLKWNPEEPSTSNNEQTNQTEQA